MIWQYILTGLSCALFFGFVALCVWKFGLHSCYSAYGMLWREAFPPFNIWSVITFTTAALLIPPILEASKDNPWQAVAFFCPALIMFVAVTPDYGTNPSAGILHSVCAALSALLSLVFIITIAPHLWGLPVLFVLLATVAMFACGAYSAMFWYEMAAYATIYTAMFILIKNNLEMS